MSQKHALIEELRREAASTRRMLERVPTDKNDWKPHAKSMPLGRLATHIAELPGWISSTLESNELDFAKMEYKPVIATSTEELLAKLDEHVNKAIASIENASDEEFGNLWTMRNGEKIFFTMPKSIVIRNFAVSHHIHHRGQLSVYLRLLDVPVPGMYGPSADEVPGRTAPVEEVASAN